MIDNIFKDIANSVITKSLQKAIPNDKLALLEKYVMKNSNEIYGESLNYDVSEFSNLKNKLKTFFNKTELFSENIGTHPDFENVDEIGEKHYIVSVFVDIKGSTKLATIKGLSLEEVREIKNKILTAAIIVFQVFDGHIHRLQGDAIFGYFGNKSKTKSNAIIDALNATTILQYTFKDYISKLLTDFGMPEMKIRTGIDFGNDEDVLWSKYGIENCTEITTTSIHTDLAAKLQHKAGANKIMIGNNIKEFLDLPEEFYSTKTYIENGETKEDKYILEHKEYRYKMWEFNWEKYLIRFPNFLKNTNYLPVQSYTYFAEKDYEIECYYKPDKNNEWVKYERNLSSIPKNYHLKFRLNVKNQNLKYLTKRIEWEVNNRGREAEEEGETTFITKTSIDSDLECPQATAYKGHHYMRMKIISKENRVIGEDYFGVYVSD